MTGSGHTAALIALDKNSVSRAEYSLCCAPQNAQEIRVITVSTAAHGFGGFGKELQPTHQMYQNLYEENLGEVLEFVILQSSSCKNKNVPLFWG